MPICVWHMFTVKINWELTVYLGFRPNLHDFRWTHFNYWIWTHYDNKIFSVKVPVYEDWPCRFKVCAFRLCLKLNAQPHNRQVNFSPTLCLLARCAFKFLEATNTLPQRTQVLLLLRSCGMMPDMSLFWNVPECSRVSALIISTGTIASFEVFRISFSRTDKLLITCKIRDRHKSIVTLLRQNLLKDGQLELSTASCEWNPCDLVT